MSLAFILKTILCIDAVAVIILCLLQSDVNDSALNAFNGQSSLFANSKDRGAQKKVTIATYICIIVFVGTVVTLGLL